MIYVDFIKNFQLADSSQMMAVRLISAYWAQKTFDSYLLDMMYVVFMKIFYFRVFRVTTTVFKKEESTFLE